MNQPVRLIHQLAREGVRLNKSLGQHFLADEAILAQIAQASGAGPDTIVVEIGAGLGNLTFELAQLGARILAVEKDTRYREWQERGFAKRADLARNIKFIFEDALEFDFARAAALARDEGCDLLIAGNIPYQITSPLVMRILEEGIPFRAMTFLVQREVADRFAAGSGTRSAGAITLKAQFYAEMTRLFGVPPRAFVPRPAVDSAVITFRRREALLPELQRVRLFRLIDAAFAQRRKMLANSVAARLPHLGKDQVAEALESIARPRTARAEELTLDDFRTLATRLGELPAAN